MQRYVSSKSTVGERYARLCMKFFACTGLNPLPNDCEALFITHYCHSMYHRISVVLYTFYSDFGRHRFRAYFSTHLPYSGVGVRRGTPHLAEEILM